ncbi:MAG: GNAT family N-acetyltransferase [Chloroflexi bacterium]|nr:GNAT family N-acetyltransferase [Chloroflexota bacterium]
MTIEIRPCADRDELKRYGEIVRYVFASNDQEVVDDELASTQPEWTTCAFVDGQMATTLGAFPFTVRLNGAPVPMAGVTAVGTLPHYRRQGLLRKVMDSAFDRMQERGQPLAILWASMGAIYQRFGYGLATQQAWYTFDPRFARFETETESRGSITLENRDDAFPTLKRNYIEYATPRNLMIHRSVPLWEQAVFRPAQKGHPVYIAIYRNEHGESRGHVVYRTAERHGDSFDPGPNQVLDVADFIALDIEAYRALWNYVKGHDLAGTVRMWNALPEDDPAPDLLLEPRMLRRQTTDGIWMRVVNVEGAMPARPYGARGELTFAIAGDTMCEWNNGTYLLETDGPTASVTRTSREPDLVMPVNSLATLLSGLRTATHLARAGRIEVRDARALPVADALFRTEYAPHCPDGF